MRTPHTVVFCGTPEFAVPSLRALASDPAYDVLLAVTQPDKPAGRNMTLTPPPVKTVAEELGISVFQPANIKKEADALKRLTDAPDYLVVVAYGQILPQELLDWPRIAPVNLHASLLPALRGASPIQHALLEGYEKTGVTVQRMVAALDAGPVLGEDEVRICARETATSLSATLQEAGAKLLVRTLGRPLQPVPQREEQATYCRKLSREDGIVDPQTMTARDIDRKVRALVPWPGVRWGEEKLIETSLTPHHDAFPLACANDTTLYVVRIQSPGKRTVTGAEWMRGKNP